MPCLTCGKSALRHPDNPKTDAARRVMAKVGFVCCLDSPNAATFKPLNQTCPSFVEADPETVTSRVEWATKYHGHVAQVGMQAAVTPAT